MTALRSYLFAFTVLCLVLTSQTMAMARGAQGPAGQVVLCTGTGPVTVLIDAEGQPTGPVHICPDCALGLFDAPSLDQDEIAQPLTPGKITVLPDDLSPDSLNQAVVRARGPPGRV